MEPISGYAKRGFQALWHGRREVALLAWPLVLIETSFTVAAPLWQGSSGIALLTRSIVDIAGLSIT